MTRSVRALAAMTLAVGLAACGDDSATTTVTTAAAAPTTTLTPGTPAVCGPLAEVVRMSDEFSLEMNGVLASLYAAAGSGQELDATQEAALLDDFRLAFAEAAALTDRLVLQYDAAAALADPGLAADIVAVRDATTILMPVFEEALDGVDTFAEFGSRFETAMADPAIAEVAMAGGLAALSIDEFSIPECGFKVSND